MLEPDFIGLAEHVKADFKPHFTDVVRRANRRRLRSRIAGAAVVTVASAGAAGMSVGLLPAPSGSIAATPTPASTPQVGYPGAMWVGDLTHLYYTYMTGKSCPSADCVVMVAATPDEGATWQRYRVPIPTGGAFTELTPLGPLTLVVSWESRAVGSGGYLASTDAGRTWRAISVRTAAAIPTGWRLLTPPYRGPYPQTVAVLAADPGTGDVVRLAPDPDMSAGLLLTDFPSAAGIWLTGSELLPIPPESIGPESQPGPDGKMVSILRGPGTVAVSHDGGQTWQRSRFPDMNTGYDNVLPPTVATYDGRTAYVLVPKGDDVVVYRSDDGGTTWAPTGGTLPAKRSNVFVDEATVRPDGTLLIQLATMSAAALTNTAIDAGVSYTAYASTDGGRTLRALPEDHVSAEPVSGGYVQVDPVRGYWLSTDGVSGSWITPPNAD